jgi:transcriptional regulator with XRE-family HTH domain
MTLAELSDRAGLHLQSLARLERGERSPAWETVLALAEALGVTPNDFLEGQ